MAPTINAFDVGDVRATALTFSIVPEGGQGADLRATEVDTSPAISVTDGEKSTDRGVRVVGTIREHVRPGSNTDHSVITDGGVEDDPLLPLGLDSHRYRCCGNGVIAPVSEWIGHRLAAVLE